MIALTIDGVLRQPDGGTIGTGTLLYRSLVAQTTVALIDDSTDPSKVDHWLAVNTMDEHAYVIRRRATDPEDAGERRVQQLLRLKAAGAVDALVEADPSVVETVLLSGTPTLLHTHPAYARPEFLPGHRNIPSPWGSLMSEVDRQHQIKANDARLAEELP